MKRIQPLLARAGGEAEVKLEFDMEASGVHTLRGRVRAELPLACQRCLEPMLCPVELDLALSLVRSEAEAERKVLPYEPYVVDVVPMDLSDIIEDELLLELPQVPMHEIEQCPAKSLAKALKNTPAAAEKENPFAVLGELKAELKTKDHD
ncbi:MAG: DUF177 domain-containing protein [Pseudomonadota bacterium]|nr:MAG: DUF177 domain-containing protein [Pseudomonadota bacterium]